MNLIIDIGNTAAKIAVMDQGHVIIRQTVEVASAQVIEQVIRQNFEDRDAFAAKTDETPKREVENFVTDRTDKTPTRGGSEHIFSHAIISSTRTHDAELCAMVKALIPNTILFDHNTPIPLKNLYHTPQTLGRDRLAAAVGAWSICPDNELLIIDLGTAITIDRVTARGEFLGGNISPGVKLRFQALHQFTDRLPLVCFDDNVIDCQSITSPVQPDSPLCYGQSTTRAIWNGVVQGIRLEIQGYMAENPSAKIFFTGGDAKNFVMYAENAIFADCELVIKGLDRIIQHNCFFNRSQETQ